ALSAGVGGLRAGTLRRDPGHRASPNVLEPPPRQGDGPDPRRAHDRQATRADPACEVFEQGGRRHQHRLLGRAPRLLSRLQGLSGLPRAVAGRAHPLRHGGQLLRRAAPCRAPHRRLPPDRPRRDRRGRAPRARQRRRLHQQRRA
ncbi:MAG: Spore_coat_synthesis_protein_SpsF, partial [uncultured Solirubrobacteraceae bacterium]